MSRVSAFIILASFFLLPPASAITFFSLFTGDNVVLHSGAATGARVWGSSSSPNSLVSLSLDGAPAGTATADAAGRWEAVLPPRPPSWRAVLLSAADASGAASTRVRFGVTILCSGQSNQQMRLEQLAGGAAAVASALSSYAGRISLASLQAPFPRPTHPPWNGTACGTRKQPPSCENAPMWNRVANGTVNGFSGLCWLTGKNVFDALGGTTPVGLLVGSVGGSPIEAWLPKGVLGVTCPADQPPCDTASGLADSIFYDAWIAPFAPYTLSMVVWDQAERDVHCIAPSHPSLNKTAQYPCMQRALVESWRAAFQSHFAFAAVQLPGYIGDCWEQNGTYTDCVPGVFNMRLAQDAGVANLSNASAVVTYDLSCPFGVVTPECPFGSVHNINKTIVAARVASALLSRVAPARFPAEAPLRAVGATAAPAGGGSWLVTVAFDGAPVALRGTQYCEACCSGSVGDFDATDGGGGGWVNGSAASLSGGGGVVFTVALPNKPTEVRYTANQGFPQCAVVGGNGLPAFPFAVEVAAG